MNVDAPANPDAAAVLGSLSARELDGLTRDAPIPAGVNLFRLHKTGKHMVCLAARLGWTARNMSDRKRAAVLPASPLDPTITMPVTPQIRAGAGETLHRKIVRYGDPALIAALAERVTRERREEARRKKEKDASPVTVPERPDQAPRARDADGPTVPGKAPGEEASAPEALAGVIRDGRDDAPVAADGTGSRVLLSETPLLAKAGRAAVWYESGAVLERRWSDGTVDYACSWDGCGYVSGSLRSVASHYARSLSHDQPADAGNKLTGPWYEPEHRPASLEREIRDAWPNDASGLGRDEMASLLAERILAARAEGRGEAEPREELTAEQVLDRIRRLADRGEYARAVEREHALAERLAGLEAELRQARDREGEQLAEALAAVRERDEQIGSMRSELNTIKELIEGIGGGPAGSQPGS